MYWKGRTFSVDRHRRILGFSRFEETPRRLLIELNEARSDYTVQEDEDMEHTSRDWQALHNILKEAQEPLTRREILAMWPEESDKPDDATLWRWLDRAVNQGMVTQEGSGKRGDAFRYTTPERD